MTGRHQAPECLSSRLCVNPGAPPAAGGLCAGCLDNAATQIRALPGLYVDLGQDLTCWPQRNDNTGGVTSPNKSASSPPVNMSALSLREAIGWNTYVWEAALRRHMGIPQRGIYRVREAVAARECPTLLANNIDTLADMPFVLGPFNGAGQQLVSRDGYAAINRLSCLYDWARRLLCAAEVTVSLPGTCSDCKSSAALRRRLGDSFITCGLCGARQLYSVYQRAVELFTDARLEWIPTVNRTHASIGADL